MPQALGKIISVFISIILIKGSSCNRDSTEIQDSDNNIGSFKNIIKDVISKRLQSV